MTMTQFELWIKGCEDNKTILYCLEGSGDTAFYKTQNEYWNRNNRFYTKPVYHVWKKGKRICCNTNFLEAYHKWKGN